MEVGISLFYRDFDLHRFCLQHDSRTSNGTRCCLRKSVFRKEQNREIKSIMTDMQTILRGFDSTNVQELTRKSRAIVKQELRQNAIAIPQDSAV